MQSASLPEPTRPGWSDLADVARIQLASFRRDLAYKRWMLAFFWIVPGITFLITREDETVTGCIISDNDRGRVRIMNIAVHPEYRNRGIGKLLMHSVMAQKPDSSVVLMVEEINTAAQAMYTDLGFARTGYHPNYYGTGHTGIEMTLKRR
jgi:[ribosomal protein S18]-alanine N-acetyltransferase